MLTVRQASRRRRNKSHEPQRNCLVANRIMKPRTIGHVPDLLLSTYEIATEENSCTASIIATMFSTGV